MSVGPLSTTRSFPGDRSAARAVVEWFRDSAPSVGLASDRRADAELCLDELVTNIVRYGRDGLKPLSLTVALEREPEAFLVVLEDDGPPFDPRLVMPPPAASSLEEAPLGGRGISLVRSFSDGLRYERGDGRNRVTIVFRQARASP